MITVTPEALHQFRTMLDEQADKALVIRLYVRNEEGQVAYGMSWGESDEDDIVVESDGVRLHLEEESAPFLAGSEISYMEDTFRKGFAIRNPSMGGGCACGRGACACGGH